MIAGNLMLVALIGTLGTMIFHTLGLTWLRAFGAVLLCMAFAGSFELLTLILSTSI